jgi:membrane-bound lytic murein transglycosylase MltF
MEYQTTKPLRRLRVQVWLAALLCLLGARVVLAAEPATEPASEVRVLNVANKPWFGDLDKLVARRMIRVLLPYSRTLYFTDRGRERGLTADLVREFERFLNQKQKTGSRPITVYMIPTTRDQLLAGIAGGLGDLAAGNLTVTPEREQVVDFAIQERREVREVVVTGPKAEPVVSLEALGGRRVHVRRSSSYFESLVALNDRLRGEGRPEVSLVLVPEALEDEDLMEMANAGIVDLLVVDDWKARIWAQILPGLRVRDDLVLRDAGRIGWAIRKGSPLLAAALDDFYDVAWRTASYEYRLTQTLRRVKQIQDPTRSADWRRFEELQALFLRYGERYGFDPLMLTAQGYQESGLDQAAKSPVGAIGVMQLMPETGASMKVGDVTIVEHNIHAGAKYLDQLMTRYFPDARFSEAVRPLFAFAAYNCGPGNVARLRREAAKRGLDPDKWFNNVELVVAEKIGAETTTYVRNIYKYYVTYKLTLEMHEAQRLAREAVSAPRP